MTYLVLNVVFVIAILATLLLSGQLQKQPFKPIISTLGILLVLTAVFDSVIIQLGLVTYDATKILGVYIGKAPIEDFAYTIAVVVLIPVLWRISEASKDE